MSDPDGIRACDESRVQRVERCSRRTSLVHPSRGPNRPHDRARIGERHTERNGRLLALHGVLDDVRREAVEPETDINPVRDLVGSPLRWSNELLRVKSGERCVSLGPPRCELVIQFQTLAK